MTAAISSRTRRQRETRAAYLLLAPTILALLTVLVYPFAWEIWASFSPLQERFARLAGLANYRQPLAQAQFWRAAFVTVVYARITSVAKLGLGFALLLARPFRGRALVFLAIFLPRAYPVSVIGWFWTLSPPVSTAYAPLMRHLRYAVGGVLGDGTWAFVSVTLFNIWRGSSFVGVSLLAGVHAIPPELFEHALLDSTSARQRFRSVTVPLLAPFPALGVFLRAGGRGLAEFASHPIFQLLGQARWLGADLPPAECASPDDHTDPTCPVVDLVPESRQTAGDPFAIGAVREVFRADNVAVFYSHTPGASQLARRQEEAPGRAGIRVPVYHAFNERVIVQIRGGRRGVVHPKDRAAAEPR